MNDQKITEATLSTLIEELADKYAKELDRQIKVRLTEMEHDDRSYYLIYQVLRITEQEGYLIDAYQNKGRFLYKYAGSFLESAATLCFVHGCEEVFAKYKVENTLGKKPKEFEIDCLIGMDAIEIKWRDATTDGDHITKEHTRVRVIQAAGYKPIRVMFYYPNREQAIRIQDTLKTLYHGVGGEYYARDEAWDYVRDKTKFDLKGILIRIAEKNTRAAEENAIVPGEVAKQAEEKINQMTLDNEYEQE